MSVVKSETEPSSIVSNSQCIYIKELVSEKYLFDATELLKTSCADQKLFISKLYEHKEHIHLRNYNRRKNNSETEERKEYPSEYVVKTVFGEKIVYIKFDRFEATTAEKLENALNLAVKKEVESLVIDIRKNQGGVLSSIIDAMNVFVSKKNILLLSTEGKTRESRLRFVSTEKKLEGMPDLVLLVSKETSLGAEAFASTLSLQSDAVLVGEKTAGLGYVKTYFPLGSDLVMTITTAEMVRADGVKLQDNGVSPQIRREYISRKQGALSENDILSVVDDFIMYMIGRKSE